MHPCPVSLNEDAACDCDSGLSLCLRYLPISGSSADSPLYLFLQTFPVPSRLLAASRPPLLVVFVLEPAARPFAPNPLLAALCPRLHVNPSLLSLLLRRPVSSTSSDSTCWISRVRAWPTTPGRALSPLDTSTLVARAALDIIALSLPLRTSTAPHATPAIPISIQREPGQNTPAGHGGNPTPAAGRSSNGHHAPCTHYPRHTRGVVRRLMLITNSLTGRGREPGLGSSPTSRRATNTSLITISLTIGESVSIRPKFTASCPAECHRGLHLSAGSSCSWPAGQLATNTSSVC